MDRHRPLAAALLSAATIGLYKLGAMIPTQAAGLLFNGYDTVFPTVAGSADRTVKLWDGLQIKERFLIEEQPDWVRAMTFVADDQTLAVGIVRHLFECEFAAHGRE